MRNTDFDLFNSSHGKAPTISEALDLAKKVQVEAEYSAQVRQIAGRLDQKLLKLFPGNLKIIFILTKSARRHVWFLYLANRKIDDPASVRYDLLTKSNTDLVTETFGSLPSGFLHTLKGLSVGYKGYDLYAKLHQLLSESPDLARKLSASEIDEDIVELFLHLPEQFRTMSVARAFCSNRNYQAFKRLCEIVAFGDPDILHESLLKVRSSASLECVIWSIYNDVEFPEPVISPRPDVTHIRNGKQLRKIAKEWENCLDMYVEEAIRNKLQFYILQLPSGQEVIFSLKNDFPFGWYVGEVKDKQNECLDLDQMVLLEEWFVDLGFPHTESVNDQIKSFLCDCSQANKWRRRRSIQRV